MEMIQVVHHQDRYEVFDAAGLIWGLALLSHLLVPQKWISMTLEICQNPFCNGSGSLHESQLQGLDLFGLPGGSEDLHGWEHVHKCLSEGKSDGYELSSPADDMSALQLGPNVTDPMRVEPVWQNRALASRSKCQRADRESLP